MEVPEDRAQDYIAASQRAIDVVASSEFRSALDEFISSHAGQGAHSPEWEGVEAGETVAQLLEGFNGLSITTMNDISGFFKHRFYGTKASDGSEKGPIYLNPFYEGSIATYANTFAHEAAHRQPADLGHDHYQIGSSAAEKKIGLCEPPYVIGSLVERQIESELKSPQDHCALLFGGGAGEHSAMRAKP